MNYYSIRFTPKALDDVAYLKKSDKSAYSKLFKLLTEMQLNPVEGTGKPKILSGNKAGFFSRRITRKHRLVYSVNHKEITILVVSAANHYDDK